MFRISIYFLIEMNLHKKMFQLLFSLKRNEKRLIISGYNVQTILLVFTKFHRPTNYLGKIKQNNINIQNRYKSLNPQIVVNNFL